MLVDTMIPEAFAETHDFAGLITVIGFLIAFVLCYLAIELVSFLLPLVCFVGVLAYATQWERLERRSRAPETAPARAATAR